MIIRDTALFGMPGRTGISLDTDCYWEGIKMIRLASLTVAMLIGVGPLAHAVTCSERMADLSKKMEAVTTRPVRPIRRRLRSTWRWRKRPWRRTTKAAA